MAKGNGEFKIEKGIKQPTPRGSRGRFPFGEMKIGDSFACEAAVHPQVNSAASWYGKRNGKKFSVRRDGDGYRCWRMS